MESSVCCAQCSTRKARAESFVDLALAFPEETAEEADVVQMLQQLLKPEEMKGDNRYQCEVCNALSDAVRTLSLREEPARLVLTLKRFGYANCAPHKILRGARFPEYLQLAQRYRLYAVVMHSGRSAQHGHYYAYCRRGEDWFLCDDSFVKPSSLQQCCSVSQTFPSDVPYMLNYAAVEEEEEQQQAVEVPAHLVNLVSRE